MSSLSEYFEQHEEQAFIAKAFLTIFAIILVRQFLGGLLLLLFFLFPVIFLIYIRFQAAVEGKSPYALLKEHITFMPVMYTEGERKKEVIPWVTYGIILTNVLVFYLFEASGLVSPEFLGNLVFLPDKPNAWNVVVSAFTHMFLHASPGHLWGNMVFLWVLGTSVERRIGAERFALLYLITGLCGGIAFVATWYLATGEPGHLLGASGAIAGIMGIFAVRCYFKSMVFPLPILGIFSLIFPVSLKVRLNSLVIIGLFFLADLSGGIGQMAGTGASMIGHWAHLGGMISGMGLAGFLKLGEGAVEERHLDIGVKAAESAVGTAGGEQSLRLVLEKSPDNTEALLALARIKSRYAANEEGRALFARTIDLLLRTNQGEAAAVYLEYRQKYFQPLAPGPMVALAGIFQRRVEMDVASRCLEAVIAMEGVAPELRQRALSQYAIMLDKMGCEDMALAQYETLVREFPHADVARRAYARLGREMPDAPAAAGPAQVAAPASAPPPAAAEAAPSPQPAAAPRNYAVCPSCSSMMQKRRASNGAHAGKYFWVCPGYPECKSVIPA